MTESHSSADVLPHTEPRRTWRRPMWITAALVVPVAVLYLWPRPWPVFTTPGGHRITHVVLGHFVVPNESPVLRFRYETTLPLTDTLALKAEALDIWPRFHEDVERGGYVNAAFRAEAPPTGPCYRHRGFCRYQGFGFLVRKHADERWYFEGDTVPLP